MNGGRVSDRLNIGVGDVLKGVTPFSKDMKVTAVRPGYVVARVLLPSTNTSDSHILGWQVRIPFDEIGKTYIPNC